MIIIRVDANEYIGLGHLMRCISIAKAFASRNYQVLFVTADDKGERLIRKNRFDMINLFGKWDRLDEELPAITEITKNKDIQLLLIDSYHVSDNYFRVLSSYVKTAYIDDLNESSWTIDYLINYNIFAGSYDYSSYQNKKRLLLGPEFAPLREEFKEKEKHIIKNCVSDVYISAGGSDPVGITEHLINAICPEKKEICFHIIIGALNPRIENIRRMVEKNIILHIDETNVSELMMKCDIAISASGTTLYELCACGVPTITYSIADNQVIAAEAFAGQGIMINAGDYREGEELIKNIRKEFDRLEEDAAMRMRLSEKMQALVDGKGAERIVDGLWSDV